MHRSLKANCMRQTVLWIPFRFRFLFGCNRRALCLHDFDPRYFPGRWYEWYKQSSKDDSESDSESDSQSDSETSADSDSDPDYTYSGYAIVFPLRVKCHLHWSPSGFVGIVMVPIHLRLGHLQKCLGYK